MTNWEKIRADYPVCNNCTYFFTNGGGPVSTPLVQKATALLTELSEKGRGVMPGWDQQGDEVRALVAGMIHAKAIGRIDPYIQGCLLPHRLWVLSLQ